MKDGAMNALALLTDEELGFRVYSPESSDRQRFGDWQTKAATIGGLVVVVIILWFVA